MFDFKKLLQAGVHFGHKTSFGNPKMRPYIWGAKNRIHLIDVSKTAVLLDYAGKALKELVGKGGSILWIGTKKPAQSIIEKAGKELDMPHVIHRWIGGTLSNYSQVKKAITRLLHLRDIVEKADTSHYTKKELVMLQKQLNRLDRNVGGIVDIAFPPAAIVVIDAKKEHSAVKEAFGMNIPVIALVDTNTDPSDVNYLIPGNDDSPKSIAVIVDYLVSCAAEGKKLAEQKKTEAADASATRKKVEKKATAKKPVEKKTTEDKEVKKVEKKVTTKKVVKKTTAKKTVAKKTTKKAATKK
jgi:small subunit ribosomal protein S2